MRECAAGLYIKAVNISHSQKASRPQVMYTLFPLIVAALACALARPPVESNAPQSEVPEQILENIPPSSREYFQKFILPKFIVGPNAKGEDSPRVPRAQGKGLIEQQLSNMINELEDQQRVKGSRVPKYTSWAPNKFPPKYYMRHSGGPQSMEDNSEDYDVPILRLVVRNPNGNKERADRYIQIGDKRNPFGLTPEQNGYYEDLTSAKTTTTEPASQPEQVPFEPRETRQNPNWSKNKAFVADNLDRLRAGFTNEDADGTVKPSHIHVLETSTVDSINSIYGIALMAAVGAALAMAITGLVVGWYTLSRKAKAAADVDYPAYGVTGPTIDSSGDRKLAQSAHMYHYQHQKQQIIAMERNGIEHPDGSVSDPDSEEDNDEGDYTVYECPGFATTGDMEVKNPLFKEDTTPISPPKSDTDKSQPKE